VTKLRAIFRRHERRVWILWAIGVVVLVLTPYALSDPALWIFVFDPELLALFTLVGVALLRETLSLHVVHLRAILALRRLAAAPRRETPGPVAGVSPKPGSDHEEAMRDGDCRPADVHDVVLHAQLDVAAPG
jgi:hypothetical protein